MKRITINPNNRKFFSNDFLEGFKYGTQRQYEADEAECPHWIPVKERLPKEDGSYLVSGKWGSGKESVGDCEFSVEDGYFRTAWNFDVLAWMPKPEPYREEDA